MPSHQTATLSRASGHFHTLIADAFAGRSKHHSRAVISTSTPQPSSSGIGLSVLLANLTRVSKSPSLNLRKGADAITRIDRLRYQNPPRRRSVGFIDTCRGWRFNLSGKDRTTIFEGWFPGTTLCSVYYLRALPPLSIELLCTSLL